MSQSTRNMRSRSARFATLSAALSGAWLFGLAASFAHADYYDEAATDVCGCLKEPYAIAARALESIRTAQQTGDFSQMAKYQGEMMGVVNGSTRCFEGLSEKYPDIKASEDKQRLVMDRVEKTVPESHEATGNAIATSIPVRRDAATVGHACLLEPGAWAPAGNGT